MNNFKEGILAGNKSEGTTTQHKHAIIKNTSVVFGKTKVIQAESFNNSGNEPRVSPLIQDGEVIGISVECSCGENVKVYFEYSDNL